jgi:hypothetical protein
VTVLCPPTVPSLGTELVTSNTTKSVPQYILLNNIYQVISPNINISVSNILNENKQLNNNTFMKLTS